MRTTFVSPPVGGVINNRGHHEGELLQDGPQLTYLNASHFQYRDPNLEEYQKEKHLEVIATASSFSLPQFNTVLSSVVLALSSHEQLSRSWQYFFKPRLESIISQHSFEIPALFPGHTVRAVNSDTENFGRHQRGTLFFDQYVDMLNFEGGLPEIISGQNSAIQTTSFKSSKLNWIWTSIDEPQLLYVVPPHNSDGLSFTQINKYLQCTAERLLSDLSKNDLSAEYVLDSVHNSWTADNPHYSELVLQAAEQIIESVKMQISSNIVLPFMFELEAMTSILSSLSRFEVFASGIFAGNWVEIATLPVLACRGSELCNEDRLFQELLKLTEHRFAPLIVNETGNVCDGNHRLTAVWIWNLLKACIDCNWDLQDMQFQRSVAGYLSSQEMKPHAVSIHQALNHLGAFLQDPSKRELLLHQLAPCIRKSEEIQSLPVVLLPEYLSSAVIKDLYDESGVRIRIQPSTCEFMTAQPNAVLPARGTYHFADCAPLPWFQVT